MSSDPDQIRQNIEVTHGELEGDVNALTEKASAMADKYNPRKAVNRRANRMRDAFHKARDKVMGTATSAGNAASAKAGQVRDQADEAASDVGQAALYTASNVGHTVSTAPKKVREQAQGSPLAAGLIAFGAGMLISSLLPAGDAERQMVGRVKDTAAEHSGQIKQGLSGATQQVRQGLREPTQHAAESVKATAGRAASNVRSESQSAGRDVREQARQAGQNVKS
jgi:hypothetical protein